MGLVVEDLGAVFGEVVRSPARKSPGAAVASSLKVGEAAKLSGKVSRIIFSKPEDHFFIFRLDSPSGVVSVKGTSNMLRENDEVEVSGVVENSKFGMQIKADGITNLSFSRMIDNADADEAGARAFLASGVVKGMGKVTAGKIVDRFGKDALRVIREDCAKLSEIHGISPNMAESFHRQVIEQKAITLLAAMLGKYGFSIKMFARIYAFFGRDIQRVMNENPYRLCEVPGIGFKKADQYALDGGCALDSPLRLREGIKYVLRETVSSKGSCAILMSDLMAQSIALLGVRQGVLQPHIQALFDSNSIMAEGDLVFDAVAWNTELSIARHIARLRQSDTGISMEGARALVARAESSLSGLPGALDGDQREAVAMALANPVSVITGQPGTGKTTIIRVLIEAMGLLGVSSQDVLVAAPTGKAANRLSQSCGHGVTQHRMLGYDGTGFAGDEGNPVSANTVCIDEFSMDDIFLANATVKAISTGTRLVILGDVNQLPSVGPGQVLRDLIDSGFVPVSRLSKIQRQGEGSGIVMAARMINSGSSPKLDSGMNDFVISLSGNPADDVINSVQALLKSGAAPDMIQVLSPRRSGQSGVQALNVLLQPILNPISASGADRVERFETRYYQGDRVMQMSNDYERNVFNGDIGKVVSVNPDGNAIVVDFEGHKTSYSASDLDSLSLAYACTVHKFQGSEALHVVMPIAKDHFILLNRNLVYTGVTRAKLTMNLIVEKDARGNASLIYSALGKSAGAERITRLKGLLEALLPAASHRQHDLGGIVEDEMPDTSDMPVYSEEDPRNYDFCAV